MKGLVEDDPYDRNFTEVLMLQPKIHPLFLIPMLKCQFKIGYLKLIGISKVPRMMLDGLLQQRLFIINDFRATNHVPLTCNLENHRNLHILFIAAIIFY